MSKDIPHWKIAATVGGAALTLNAVWLNAVHIAHAEGWSSPLVAAGIIVTACAAVAPPFAERAANTGQPLKAVLVWAFFALAVGFSLSSSIARSSGYADGKTATAEKIAEKARLAKEGYAAAKATREAECSKRGPKCRAAEDAVTAARNALATAAPVIATDPGAERVAAVLGIQEASVALYAPLLLPLGLELGGFIFLALGLAPRRREDGIATSPPWPEAAGLVSVAMPAVADPKPATVSKGGKAYYMQRLERDHPAIAKRVQDGELSVYAARRGRHPQERRPIEMDESRRIRSEEGRCLRGYHGDKNMSPAGKLVGLFADQLALFRNSCPVHDDVNLQPRFVAAEALLKRRQLEPLAFSALRAAPAHFADGRLLEGIAIAPEVVGRELDRALAAAALDIERPVARYHVLDGVVGEAHPRNITRTPDMIKLRLFCGTGWLAFGPHPPGWRKSATQPMVSQRRKPLSASTMRNIFGTISSLLLRHGLPSKVVALPSARVTTNHAQSGEAFSARLRALGVSQRDFAIVCGVTKRTVSNWAAGRHRVSPAAMTLLEVLEKRQAFIVKPKKEPRGRPFEPGNAYRFGDRRRRTAIAGAQMARATA